MWVSCCITILFYIASSCICSGVLFFVPSLLVTCTRSKFCSGRLFFVPSFVDLQCFAFFNFSAMVKAYVAYA